MGIEVHPDWWKDLFDEIYLLTDARSVCSEEITRREVDMILKLLPLSADQRILDLCGGHGRHSLELCSRGFSDITVLDYSQYLIEHGQACAQEHGHPITFIRSDARDTKLSSESFDDVLVLGNSLGYHPDPISDHQILSEARRVLKPEGRLLLDVTNGASVKAKLTPKSWHEIDQDVVVCREREMRENTVRTREMVLDKSTGIIRDQTYCIRMYEPASLISLIEDVGFKKITAHTDFSPHKDDGDYGFMNHRMIVIAQKP